MAGRTNSVEDVISGIDPSKGASPPPSLAINSLKHEKTNANMTSKTILEDINIPYGKFP